MIITGATTLGAFIQKVREAQNPDSTFTDREIIFINHTGQRESRLEKVPDAPVNAFAHYPTGTVVFFRGNQSDVIPEERVRLAELGFDVEALGKVFGANTRGNLIFESGAVEVPRQYQIASNNTTVGDSNGTTIEEECDRTVVLRSPGFHGNEAHDNVVADTQGLDMWRSHYCVLRNCGAVQLDGGHRESIVHNADEVIGDNSPGLQVISADTSTYIASPGTRAEFASLTTVDRSPETDLLHVYESTVTLSPGFKGKKSSSIKVNESAGARLELGQESIIDRSPGFVGVHSYRFQATESPNGVADHSPNGRMENSLGAQLISCPESTVRNSAGFVGEDSFGIDVDQSSNSSVDNCPNAQIHRTSDSTFTTSSHPVAEDNVRLTVDNCDDGIFRGNSDTLTQDSYGLQIEENTDGTRVIDSIKAVAIGNRGLVVGTCAHSTFEGCTNLELDDQQRVHYRNNERVV